MEANNRCPECGVLGLHGCIGKKIDVFGIDNMKYEKYLDKYVSKLDGAFHTDPDSAVELLKELIEEINQDKQG